MSLALRTKTGRRIGAVRLRPFGTPSFLRFITSAWQGQHYPNGHVVYIPPRGPSAPSVSILMIP